MKLKLVKFALVMVCFLGLSSGLFAEAIVNGDFSSGDNGWWTTTNTTLSTTGGVATVTVSEATTNDWDAILGQDGVSITAGNAYDVTFEAKADSAVTVKPIVQMGAAPYTSVFAKDIVLTTSMTSYSFQFVAGIDIALGQFQFQLGGNTAGFTMTVDNISVTDGEVPPAYEHDTGPAVRVNQVGYVPGQPKKATFVTDAQDPVIWALKDSSNNILQGGMTTYFGYDALAGDTVHLIDFSSYDVEGTGYILEVDGIASYPFDISKSMYDTLKYDALAYFYHNRSGIEIEAQYAGAEYARPAGHIGLSPNNGDTSVPTASDVPGNYSLDVSGGWYDAGDHGKYVVNGGISVWKLLNQYERSLYVDGADSTPFADGKLSIPEQGNNVADILDEVRWEVEFFLKMQVPDGEEKAGMVHHKIHDESWTGLPLLPHLDSKMRYLRPASVTATLNMAATASMASRLWENIDPVFSGICLSAAEKAWTAALANPTDLAPGTDGTGGGAYNDNDASDEFYWAAAELYITTGKAVYKNYVTSSSLFGQATSDIVGDGGFAWADVAACGDISMLTVPNGLSAAELTSIKNDLVTAADELVNNVATQGYPNPYKPAKYVWGSNNMHLNNLIVVGTAYDVTGTKKYLDTMFESMDYILGRNALNLSYVTGYGDKYAKNQHHRHWANQKDPSLPNPLPGSVAGGPNAGLEDSLAFGLLSGLPSAKCYIDEIDSWSTNEITINWNSALSWVVAYLGEKDGETVVEPPDGLIGDVDGDGTVNIIDAMLIARCSVGLVPCADIEIADFDCSGTIDIVDALMVARYSVGLVPAPVCN